MPLDSGSRIRGPFAPGLDLPPPFRAVVVLREVGDAFAHATQIAARAGAGTLVYVGRFDLAEFAVVLEPEEPLRTAAGLYAGLTALADALAMHAPPEKADQLRLAGCDPHRRRAGRRCAPRLAGGRRRKYSASVAGLRCDGTDCRHGRAGARASPVRDHPRGRRL